MGNMLPRYLFIRNMLAISLYVEVCWQAHFTLDLHWYTLGGLPLLEYSGKVLIYLKYICMIPVHFKCIDYVGRPYTLVIH